MNKHDPLPDETATHGSQLRLLVRILATTDLHAQLLPYDYTSDEIAPGLGLSKTAALIATARAEAEARGGISLLLDNGDFLEGFPFGFVCGDEEGAAGRLPHPVIWAMNRLGYDAAGLGNHEFSYGLPALEAALAQAAFPVIGANLVRRRGATPDKDLPYRPPVHMFTRRVRGADGAETDLRIGLVSVLPPEIEIWERRHLSGSVETRAIAETVETWVRRLKEKGADIVIALCHCGISELASGGRHDHQSGLLARIDGIDAIVAGHVHSLFPDPAFNNPPHDVDPVRGTIAGKPAVAPGFRGSHLGVIDLSLVEEDGRWRVTSSTSEARPIDPAPDGAEDKFLALSLAPWLDVVAARIQAPIGETAVPIHSYFARIADSAALALVRDALGQWARTGLARGGHETLPVLVATSPFKAGGRGGPQFFTDIAPGPLERRHMTDLYFFPNLPRAILVTGTELAEWLEMAAGQFRQVTPGLTDQPLLLPEAPSYNFDTIGGVTYSYDLMVPARYDSQGNLADPSARRVADLAHKGRPVAPGDRFIVVTNSFRSSGGGQYPGVATCPVVLESFEPITNILQSYVTRTGRVAPVATREWRIRSFPPGTSAWFDTGPRADAYLAENTDLRIRARGLTPTGFLRCEIGSDD